MNKTTLQEQIELKIRDSILSGEYRAGERLIEADLVKNYKISRTIVRESLKNLGATGLVSYISKKGYSVKKFSIEDVKNLYNLLKVLEGYACETAVPLFKSQDVAKIQKLHEKMNLTAMEGNYQKYRELNIRFHETFFARSGNKILKETIINFRTRLYSYRYLSMMFPDSMIVYNREHENIIKYVKKKDSERVKLEMQKHIETVKNNVVMSLEKAPLL